MKIKKVTQTGYAQGILLTGWQAVVEALAAYDLGCVPGSRATRQELTKAMGSTEHGNAQIAMVDMATARLNQGSKPLSFIVREAEEALTATGESWSQFFDYDGLGTSFFKTNVEISIFNREKDMFVLGLNAARVERKPEEELARYLKAERVLYWQRVTVEVETLPGNNCTFDFEAIFRRLDDTLATQERSGKEFVKDLLVVSAQDVPILPIYTKNPIVVTLGLSDENVRRRFDLEDRVRVDTWCPEGSLLHCQLAESITKKEEKLPPTFALTVRHICGRDSSAPIWKSEERKQVLALADHIAAAFS